MFDTRATKFALSISIAQFFSVQVEWTSSFSQQSQYNQLSKNGFRGQKPCGRYFSYRSPTSSVYGSTIDENEGINTHNNIAADNTQSKAIKNDEFGNIKKRKSIGTAVEEAVKTTEGVIRRLTKNESYQFGDLTKGAVSEVTKTTENIVRTVTRDEDYNLGDFTKRALIASLNDSLNKTIVDIPAQVEDVLGILTDTQKQKLNTQVLLTLGLVCLSLNFVFNVFTGLNLFLSWTTICIQNGVSPLTSGNQWAQYIHIIKKNRIFATPIIMPVQAGATYFLTFRYWKIVRWTQQCLFQSHNEKSSYSSFIIKRVVSMFAVFLIGNVISIASVTGVAILAFSKLMRIPVFEF